MKLFELSMYGEKICSMQRTWNLPQIGCLFIKEFVFYCTAFFVLCWIALCMYLAKRISCNEQFLKTQAIRTEWRMTVNTLAYLKLYRMILRRISLNH